MKARNYSNMTKLIEEIEKIPKINYDYFFNIKEDDELADLKGALNKLLDSITVSIKSSLDSLNQLNNSNIELEKAYEIIEKSDIVVFEWTLNPDVPTKYVTNNISRFGYTATDFYTGDLKDYWNFVYIEDVEKTKKAVYNARKKNVDEFKHNYRVVCKDKKIRWVEEWLILERDENGVPISEKGILRDITEQKELADKLKESEERYRNLYENAAALIYTFDLNGYITSVNSTCLQVLGYSREELLGRHFSELLLLDDPARLKRLNLPEFILKNSGRPIEFHIERKNRGRIVLESHISIVYKNNTPFEIQGVAHDITSRKLAEEKIIHMSHHDKLTGLYNRTFYDKTLKNLDESRDYPFTVIIGDMNGLKMANDAFGHKAGDSMLKQMSRILSKACRKEDIIARIGGDEFAIILPKTEEAQASSICNKIKELCTISRPSPLQLSIALGYATKRDNSTSIRKIIKEADDRMYKNKLNEINSSRSSMVLSLQATLGEKTLESKEHTERLKELSLKLGKIVGLSDSQLDELSLAALMHDIGKIAIPDSILNKPESLSKEEWDIMKKHPEIGYHILMSSANMLAIGEYILAHHERWDGNGYPRGLKGEEIPIISRIVALVDAFDVMTHNRSYCPPKSIDEAIMELLRSSGTQFDPDLVERFIPLITPSFNHEQEKT